MFCNFNIELPLPKPQTWNARESHCTGVFEILPKIFPKEVRYWSASSTFFSPQPRARVPPLKFQKWSEMLRKVFFDVFCAFWLLKVLCATMACNFSALICPNGSAPAALASRLFDPLEPQIIGKIQWFATFLPFGAPGSSFFWGCLFVDLLSSSLRFSDSSHLCFSFVHMVGSLTSKLPSID